MSRTVERNGVSVPTRELPRQGSRYPVLGRSVIAVLSAGLLTGSVALAQEATPAAGEVIDPAECQVEPLSDEFLAQLSATPASDSTPVPETAASPTPFAPPEGEPASEADIEAVTATARDIVACLNAGDYRRVYALYTEDYLARNFTGETVAQAQATPVPRDVTTQVAFIGLEDVIVLPDGRIGARMETATGTGQDALRVTLYTIYEQVDDRWLVDEEIALDTET